MKKAFVLLMTAFILAAIPAFALSSEEQGLISQVNVCAEDSLGRSITGGTLSYATFPQTIRIKSGVSGGGRTSVMYEKPSGQVVSGDRIAVNSVQDTGTYIVTATSEDGASKTIAINVKYEVRASAGASYRYRTVGIEIHSVRRGDRVVKRGLKTVVKIINGSYLEDSAYRTVEKLVGAFDGCLYTLEGSLIVEVYNSAGVAGTYVVSSDWNRLVRDYDWVPATLDAFATMCSASVTYQAPRKVKLIRKITDLSGGTVIFSSSSAVTLYPYQSYRMNARASELTADGRYFPESSRVITRFADGTSGKTDGSAADSVTAVVLASMTEVTAEFRCRQIGCDLSVSAPEDPEYPEDEDVVTCLSFSAAGTDILPGSRVSVKIEIPEIRYTVTCSVVCRQNTAVSVPFRWHTPSVAADRTLTARAELVKGTEIREYSYDNNACSFEIRVKNTDRSLPDELYREYPSVPSRPKVSRVEWTEQRYEDGRIKTHTYFAELIAAADISYTTKAQKYIRSGYGFGLNLRYGIRTNYDRPELITDCQSAWSCVPQYGYAARVYMDRKNADTWQLPVNAGSPERLRRIYVPIWWSDSKAYVIQASCGDVYTPGGVLRAWVTGSETPDLKLRIKGSMYDDDHIGY